MRSIPERLQVFTDQHPFRGKCAVRLSLMTCTVIDYEEKSFGSVSYSHEGMSVSQPVLGQRLWVKKEGGLEECIKLDNKEQYARPGHKLAFIRATNSSNRQWIYTTFYNYQTDGFFYIQEGEWRSLFYEGSCMFGCLKLTAVLALSIFLGFFLTLSLITDLDLAASIITWLIILSLLGYLFAGWFLSEMLHERFRDHLKKIWNTIL